MKRPLTTRERAVLDALLSVDFDGADELRREGSSAKVLGMCACGCPSIDFYNEPGEGMHIRVNAGLEGTYDGMFLYTVGGHLGGIEYVGGSGEADPPEFPDPGLLRIEAV